MQSVVLAIVVLAGLVGPVIALSATTAAAAAAPDGLGATKVGVRDLEDDLDRRFDVVRVFERWDSAFPDAEERLFLSEGRTLLLSIYPQRTDGTLVPWADIAATTPGSELHDDLLRWAERLAPYQDQIHFTFTHEPEVTKNLALGTAEEFRAAWRTVMQVLGDAGLVPASRLFIVTSPAFDYAPDDRRAVEHWYPGDEWVDSVGGDAYNFATCRPAEPAAWLDLAAIIEGQRQWGLAHPETELMLPEFATVADPADPDRRADWLEDARATLVDPAYDQFTAVVYFFEFDAANPDCDYTFTDDAARQAFHDLANDPALGGTPGADPRPPSSCFATVEDGQVELEWSPAYDAAGYRVSSSTADEPSVVLSELDALSFRTADAAETVWTVQALHAGGDSIAVLCGERPPEPPPLAPPPACEFARDEGFITVSWLPADDAVEYVVERSVNGAGPYWRGRTVDTEFADSDRLAELTYQVRSRAIDGTRSAAATTCVDTSPPLPGSDDPTPPPTCSFRRDGTSIAVTWQPGANVDTSIVERTVDGNGPYWRARTADVTFTDTDRTGSSIGYQVRTRNRVGEISDATICGEVEPPDTTPTPPPSCTFRRDGATVQVAWELGEHAEASIVERTVDGNGPYWRGRTTEPTFTDTDRPGSSMSYQVRSRGVDGEVSAATACEDLAAG